MRLSEYIKIIYMIISGGLMAPGITSIIVSFNDGRLYGVFYTKVVVIMFIVGLIGWLWTLYSEEGGW